MKGIIMVVYVFTSGIELGRQGGRLPFPGWQIKEDLHRESLKQ